MEVSTYLERIKLLPPHEQKELLKLLTEATNKRSLELARKKFMYFARRMWPDFIEGRHHREMAKIFDGIKRGELKRVAINLGPRHTKSKFASVYFPADYIGTFPKRKIMQLGNTQELVEGFGREVRDLIDTPEYQTIYPGVKVSAASRAASRWATVQGGEYLARGIGGKITGKGADLMVIDDPHSEQEAQRAPYDPKVFDSVYDWYEAGPRQRLQPGGAILLVNTRWGKRDLQGRIIQHAQNTGSIDEWKVFEYPVILNDKPLWPEYWPIEELLAIKRDLPASRWLAQYMQTPTTEEGAIVKRDWWRRWDKPRLPEFVYIIQSWDTAFSAKDHADYSACTTWGVFYHENKEGRRVANVMLVDAYRDRMEFPALKERVKQLKADWNPDTLIIENKGSGASLIQELQQTGIMAEMSTPTRGNDKLSRLNAVSDLFKSGFVWYNDDNITGTVIEEFAEFPNGDHDDLMDTGTQALERLRAGMFIGTANDDYQLYEDDLDGTATRRRPRLY